MTTMSTTTLVENERPPIDINTITAEEKKELVTADAISVLSSTTLGASELSFTPVKSLHINAKGVPVLRLPVPPAELITTIHNVDGTLAYSSTRAKRSSGNCVLADAEGKALIGTEYFFGPSKDPKLIRLDVSEGIAEEIKTVSKWTSRNHRFLLPDGRTLAWSYKKEKGFGANGTKGTALVLTLDEKRIAVLIRNEETRTPGSKSCNAGNGGELLLGADIGGIDGINEDLVVATVLLMLKKEVDRRRTVQFMMIAGAASGGS
ncbi:Nn.00g003350.m01.CDS01 [Neocucurbitaria sp. VM-36]